MSVWGLPGVQEMLVALRSGLLLVAFGIASCSTVAKPQQEGVLRLAGVVRVVFPEDLKPHAQLHELTAASGITEAQTMTETVYAARTLCCSRDLMKSGPVLLLNPQHLPLRSGDLVEYQVGGATSPDHRKPQNPVTRVVQSGRETEGECWWEPRNDTSEGRVAYCEWMQEQGWLLDSRLPWVKDNGANYRVWYKPRGAVPP